MFGSYLCQFVSIYTISYRPTVVFISVYQFRIVNMLKFNILRVSILIRSSSEISEFSCFFDLDPIVVVENDLIKIETSTCKQYKIGIKVFPLQVMMAHGGC